MLDLLLLANGMQKIRLQQRRQSTACPITKTRQTLDIKDSFMRDMMIVDLPTPSGLPSTRRVSELLQIGGDSELTVADKHNAHISSHLLRPEQIQAKSRLPLVVDGSNSQDYACGECQCAKILHN
jgi:hypothetical protein